MGDRGARIGGSAGGRRGHRGGGNRYAAAVTVAVEHLDRRPGGHLGGMAGPGDKGDMAGMAFGEDSAMAAAADYLGLSLTDLRAELRSGTSLADVAAAQGKSAAGLEDAMIAAMTTHLDANTTLTAEEKAAALAAMKSHLDVMVTATHSPGSGIGPLGAGMGSMMGR